MVNFVSSIFSNSHEFFSFSIYFIKFDKNKFDVSRLYAFSSIVFSSMGINFFSNNEFNFNDKLFNPHETNPNEYLIGINILKYFVIPIISSLIFFFCSFTMSKAIVLITSLLFYCMNLYNFVSFCIILYCFVSFTQLYGIGRLASLAFTPGIEHILFK